MNNQKIKCPQCQFEFLPDEAMSRQLEEKIKLEYDHKLSSQKTEIEKAAKDEAIKRVYQEYSQKIDAVKADSLAQEKQNKELREQTTELLKQMREMKTKDEARDIEFQKKLLEEEAMIKNNAKKEAQDASQLQIAQKEKQLQDLRDQLLEAQRKADQGSQQTQGEVLELELEELLRQKFIYDEIIPVAKGANGADIIQKVKNNNGRLVGTIVWESKRTKAWSEGWISKLNDDKRREKADLAVIVSTVLPDGVKNFDLRDGIALTNFPSALGIATLLRSQLFRVAEALVSNEDREKKSEIVYGYLISNEFKQRIEVWLEYFRSRQEELNKERLYFTKKWENEDKRLQKIFINTAGIYGDLQGLIGSALPKIDLLELPNVE